jgi:hypothetical protein
MIEESSKYAQELRDNIEKKNRTNKQMISEKTIESMLENTQ